MTNVPLIIFSIWLLGLILFTIVALVGSVGDSDATERYSPRLVALWLLFWPIAVLCMVAYFLTKPIKMIITNRW